MPLAVLVAWADCVPRAAEAQAPRHRYERPPPELHDTGLRGAVGRIEAGRFGVRADGCHDDTAALQAAIDAVSVPRSLPLAPAIR